MLKLLGITVIIALPLVGCGASPEVSSGSVDDPVVMVEQWTNRMRERESVRFDVEVRSDGRMPWWATMRGSLSPLAHRTVSTSAPEPISHLIHQQKPSSDAEATTSETISEKRDVYLCDPRITLPAGKTWVLLGVNDLMWAPDVVQSTTMTLVGVNPEGVFDELDRSNLTMSPGKAERLDGIEATKYELTADPAKGSQTSPGRGTRLTVTVWIGPQHLPLKVEQLWTGSDGNTNRRTSRYSDWDATPKVALPPPSQIAGTKEATWTGR